MAKGSLTGIRFTWKGMGLIMLANVIYCGAVGVLNTMVGVEWDYGVISLEDHLWSKRKWSL